MVVGQTRDELRFLAPLMRVQGLHLTASQYRRRLESGFGVRGARRVAALYPPAAEGDSWEQLYAAYSDRMFVCPGMAVGDALSRRSPVYGYEFADAEAPPYAPVPAGSRVGASHAAELLYLFDIKGKPVDLEGHALSYTRGQRRLGARMIDYWTHFAWTGRPGSAGVRYWPRAVPGRAGSPQLAFAPGAGGIRPVDGAREHHCAFWRTVKDA
ncbi:carboxylesterase family protein [Streptomyces sp. NPDC048644]|uniref:carboxylesterase family protein n=1 Tax=Streptomyces sp. NPDC048644 TaxID=3365582 RepID=UPI0037101097